MSSDKLLDSVNLLLTDQAAEWAETNPETARILVEKNFIAGVGDCVQKHFLRNSQEYDCQ